MLGSFCRLKRKTSVIRKENLIMGQGKKNYYLDLIVVLRFLVCVQLQMKRQLISQMKNLIKQIKHRLQ